jgi:hypothetical protein
MAAIDYIGEAGVGILGLGNINDAISKRCTAGGNPAKYKTTPNKIPMIREWEYAEGNIIIFSKLLSCLGAIQIAGKDSVRGAHFSEFASSLQHDSVNFGKAMSNAGFTASEPIIYFGGSVSEWEGGLGNTGWLKADDHSFRKQFQRNDVNQRVWIFQVAGGKLTCADI